MHGLPTYHLSLEQSYHMLQSSFSRLQNCFARKHAAITQISYGNDIAYA